jgi:hypothetical protein
MTLLFIYYVNIIYILKQIIHVFKFKIIYIISMKQCIRMLYKTHLVEIFFCGSEHIIFREICTGTHPCLSLEQLHLTCRIVRCGSHLSVGFGLCRKVQGGLWPRWSSRSGQGSSRRLGDSAHVPLAPLCRCVAHPRQKNPMWRKEKGAGQPSCR